MWALLTICHITPRHLCQGVYNLYIRSFIIPSCSWNYFKVLRESFSCGVYLANHSSESIHIWTIGTLEGRLSFHDSWPQSPCPGEGLEVIILDTFKTCKNLKRSSPEPKGRWPWKLVCSFGCSRTTKFVQMMTLTWPWSILRQGQIWSLML